MNQTFAVSHHGFDIPVAFSVPATRRPALLLIHDQWGVDDWMRSAAARLAERGYAVALPDLFARFGAPVDDSDAARQDFLLSLSDAQVVSDALAVLDAFATHENVDKKALGVIGWGWGGAYALLCAGHDARLRGAVDIGGDITYPVLSANRPGSPLNFLADIEGAFFAAFPEHDGQPHAEIIRLRQQLKDHDKLGEVKIFAGTTGRFWREDSPATALLWRRIEQFFGEVFDLADDAAFVDAGKANEESRLHA
jgi:dienelactone hydrolase